MFHKCRLHFCIPNQPIRSRYTLIRRSNPSTRAKLLKRERTETKKAFGNLLETHYERNKNYEYLERHGVSPKHTFNTDTEIPWMVKKFNSNVRRIVFPKKKGVNTFDINAYFQRKAAASAVAKEKSQSENTVDQTNMEQQNVINAIIEEKYEKEEIVEQDKPSSRSGRTSSIIKPLSEIVIKNIMSFPICSSAQKQSDEYKESEKAEILSRTADQDQENLDFPSVTRILRETMSPGAKAALEAWKQRKINELGQEGFDLYAKELLEHGKMLHSCIEDTLLDKDTEVPPKVEPAFNSIKPVLKEVIDVKAIESHVVHPKLQYRGFVDCVATYGGALCVIDWKKSDKEKLTIEKTYDAPIQIAAYVGALNASPDYHFEIRNGIVIVAYTSGKPAEVHRLTFEDLQKYWRFWLLRLQQYYVNLTSKEQNS